jgi:hypothetical protein
MRLTRHFASVVALASAIFLALASDDAALADKRVALVVGNSSYQNVAKLPNPAADATAIAEMFRKAGFDVVDLQLDAGNLEFKRAIRRFEDAASGADMAVAFFAGHGLELKGANYMIPIDARLADERDAPDEAIALDRIVEAVDGAKRLRLVIVDACRDNPFAVTMRRQSALRSVSRGLARIEPQGTDTLIAYAAKAGSTAEDGHGEHSPLTTALLDNLTVPGLDIRLAFGRVRDEVMKITNNRQEPFVYGSLGGGVISLVPPPNQPKEPLPADVKADYELVKEIGTRKAWEIFLNTYKTGFYSDLAAAQLAKLLASEQGGAKIATLEPPALPAPGPSQPSSDEQRVWDRIRDSGDQAALEEFIRRYPRSPLALNAQKRLETLQQIAREREEKARTDLEAAQQRAEEERRAKAAEVERQKVEQQAALQRAEEERRAKAAEAVRQKAEQQAALQRADEERRAKAAEAEKQKAEQQAALQRAEDERRAKVAEAARQKAEQQKAEQQAALQRAEDERRAKAAEAERQKAEQQAALQAKAAEAARQKTAQPVPTEPTDNHATPGPNPSDVATLEPPPAPSPGKPSSAEARAWDRIKDSDNQAALQEFLKRYPKSPLVLNAQKRLDTLHQIAQEREEKARADREAAQQRAEDEQRAKAAEAEKAKAEQQAALQRADEERRAKAAEAEKQKAERQAALQRADEERRAKAAEAEKQKAEQQAAALQRADEERRAKAAEAEKQKAEQQAALQRADDERRAKAAEAEKQKVEQQAALQPGDEERRAKAGETEQKNAALTPEKKNVPAVVSNTSELIHAAQIELSRLGCFSGKPDGTLNAATKTGIDRYLSRRGRPDPDVVVTESFISELQNQKLKNCQLDCPSGQMADGDICIASKKSSPTTKSARQHDDVPEKSKPVRQPAKQETKQADKRPERPQPQVHQEVYSPPPRESHGSGTMIGVGF